MEQVSGNIFLRKMHLAKGEVINGHTHNFDHTSIVFTGSVHIKAKLPSGQVVERDFVSPSHCLIKAEVEHEITALEDGTQFWCVYSHRQPNGDIVQEYTGWDKAYV